MIRHSSIVSLSREHHGALILARLLQKDAPPYKNLPKDLKGKANGDDVKAVVESLF